MPENVGFSASFMGLSELADGTKVFNPDAETKTHYTLMGKKRVAVPATEKIFARCQDLVSVDLVASPAANPDGMFEAGAVDSDGDDMATPVKPGAKPEEENTVDFNAFVTEQREFNSNVAALLQRFSEADEEEEEIEEEEEQEEVDASELSSLADVVQHFEARIAKMGADREHQEFEAAHVELDDKISDLEEFNAQLLNENQILAEAYKELSSKTKHSVDFSAGADGGRKASVSKVGAAPRTEFEARCVELQGEGKSAAEAMLFAVNEDTERYTTHLEAKGALAQTL